jgi:hypothetical protein
MSGDVPDRRTETMGTTTGLDPGPRSGGEKVVLLRPQGCPTSGTIRHPEDTERTAAFWVDGAGAFVLRIEGPKGRFQQEDAEGPRPRRLARLLMTLVGYGFFTDDDHAEAFAVLYGVPVADLETEGIRRAGRVVAFLAPALASP